MTDAAIIQRSPEWYAARCGSLGASQLADALAKTKSGWGASRANLRALQTAVSLSIHRQTSDWRLLGYVRWLCSGYISKQGTLLGDAHCVLHPYLLKLLNFFPRSELMLSKLVKWVKGYWQHK